MSTLKVSAVNNAAASVGGLAIDSSGNVTGALPAPNRNLLYNGAMAISQRGTSTTGLTNTATYNTADRWWFVSATTFGTQTQDIQNDAPTGSGFRRSFRVLTTTAQASPAAGDALYVAQLLEGQDLQRIRKGTSSAQKLTLSFWVKSNVTGTYIAELADLDNTRRVSASYSISASATWERKTITFPADVTGAFDNDNAASLQVFFWLGAGSNFTGGSPLQTTWGTATNTRATGQTNLASATNNYWQITGVQLETGDVATDFEFKSYGQELRECQRYYYRITSQSGGFFGLGMCFSTTTAGANVPFPVTMRVAPAALEQSGTAAHYAVWNSSGNQVTNSAVPTYSAVTSNQTAWVSLTVASGLTAGNATGFYSVNTSAYVAWSAEL